MAILLSALAVLLSTTGRAYRANAKMSEAQQSAEAAVHLLKYELALAGYRGTDAGSSLAARPLGGPGIAVTSAAGASDTVSVRYYEDRVSSSPELRRVTFSVRPDASNKNMPTLYRQESTNEPVVAGVATLKVLSYYARGGSSQTAMPPLDGLAGLTLRLSFVDPSVRDLTVAVALPNPQAGP